MEFSMFKTTLKYSFLALILSFSQPFLYAEELAIDLHTQDKPSQASEDNAQNEFNAKVSELTILKSRINGLTEYHDFMMTPESKGSFYETTNKEFIAKIGELSKEIYAAGEMNKSEIEHKYEEKRRLMQIDIEHLHQKLREYINLREDVKTGAMSPSNFMLILRARFGNDLMGNSDLSDVDSTAKQMKTLDTIRDNIAFQIDTKQKALDNMDIYYAYVQGLRVISGYFSDYEVVKIFYRHNGEQFSGALLHSISKNHLILVFPGTVTMADWGRNLQFTKYSGSFVKGESLSLHTGFVKSYNEIREQINMELARWVDLYKADLNNKGKVLEVTTTGHSKGAAMSTIAALDVAANILPEHLGPKDGAYPWKVNNPNFASPRFAGTETSKVVEKYIGKHNILRFVNYWDIVPSVVAEFTGSKHVGIGFVFNTGLLKDFLNEGPVINWHSMSKYAELAPETFEINRNKGRELTELNTQMNALKTEISSLEQKHGFRQTKSWFSAF